MDTTRPTIDDFYKQVKNVRGILIRKGVNPNDLDDIMQSAFEKLIRQWEKYDPTRCKPHSWLTILAFNIVNDGLRVEKRVKKYIIQTDDPLEIMDERPSPLDNCLERNKQERMLQAINALPKQQQEIVTILLSGNSGAETSRKVGISQSHVSRRVRESIRYLNEMLKDE